MRSEYAGSSRGTKKGKRRTLKSKKNSRSEDRLLYDLIQGKREFNPTLKTIGGLFKALAA